MTTASTDAPVHAAGEIPQKSIDSVVVSFGLVSVPLAVFAGVDKPTAALPRHQFTLSGHPVGTKTYDKTTDELITSDQIVKRAVASDGETTVEVSNDEIASVTGGPSGQAEIQKFIPLHSLSDGTYVVEGLKQLRPKDLVVNKKKLPNVGAERALALLLAGLASEQVGALVMVTFSGAARYAALLPSGHLAMLAFSEQVKAPLPLPEVALSDAELSMARQLIQTIGVGTPPLIDTTGPALQEYVDTKAAAGGTATSSKSVAAPTPVEDLIAAMAASMGIAVPEVEADSKPDPALTPEQNPPELIDEPVAEPEAAASVVKVEPLVTIGGIYERARALRVAS